MGPYQRTPKEVARAIRYSGLGVRSVGPVGDFLDNRLKSFSRVEIDQNHVDLKDSRGKGFALRRLNKHNFCPASVYYAVISNVSYILHVTYPPEI